MKREEPKAKQKDELEFEPEDAEESTVGNSPKPVSTHIQKSHPTSNIIGTPIVGVRTRGMMCGSLTELVGYPCYTSQIEDEKMQ